ncbi:hypothetical protein LLG95_08250 [bacterium]|nr:hypothetical protein [bacterium]
MIRQCCQCKKIWMNGRWVFPRLSQLEGQEISHGYCDDCFSITIKQVRRRGPASSNWFSRFVHLFMS